MSDSEQQLVEPETKPGTNHPRTPHSESEAARGIFLLPSLFTGGNLLSDTTRAWRRWWVRCCKPTLSITRESDRSGIVLIHSTACGAFDRDEYEFGVQSIP